MQSTLTVPGKDLGNVRAQCLVISFPPCPYLKPKLWAAFSPRLLHSVMLSSTVVYLHMLFPSLGKFLSYSFHWSTPWMSLKVPIKSHNSLPAHIDAFPVSVLITGRIYPCASQPAVNDILYCFGFLKIKKKNPASSETMSGTPSSFVYPGNSPCTLPNIP